MWGGQPASEAAVRGVFSAYYGGSEAVTRLPWRDSQPAQESPEDQRRLVEASQAGLLIINFLPALSCVESSHLTRGWGTQPGYVFQVRLSQPASQHHTEVTLILLQKAYLEFFTTEEKVVALSETVQAYPGVTFQAVNRAGLEKTNIAIRQPAALSWAVFNDREVVQPTVVEPDTFRVWAREAFRLWQSGWAALYEEGSEDRTFLEQFPDTLYLVYLVDNDFPR